MLITQLELRNIKSYQHETITFMPGINAIYGKNGAGKSTILEAIGFVLFDSLPYNKADFVREGEKSGEVVVRFLSNQDEREYEVERHCGSKSVYKVYDRVLGNTLVQGKDDVIAWICDHLKLDETDKLPDLFENAVGVSQGLLTTNFLAKPVPRKAAFDPLLHVDEYERTWERLRDSESYLKDKVQTGREHIAGLQAEVKPLPESEQEATKLRQEIKDDTEQLKSVQEKLKQVTEQREGLRADKEKRDNLANQLSTLEATLSGLEQQRSDAQTRLQEAIDAQQVIEETTEGYESNQKAQRDLDQLEERIKERDALDKQEQKQNQDLALAQERQKQHTETLAKIKQAEEQMQLLEPQVALQKQLEESIRKTEGEAKQFDDVQKQLTQTQEQLNKLQEQYKTVCEEIEQRKTLETKIAGCEVQLRKLTDETSTLQAQQQQMQAQQPQIEQRIAVLHATDGTTATCPVCQQPLTAEQASDLAATYQRELDDLHKNLTENQQQQNDLTQQKKEAERQQNEHQQELKKLADERQRDQLDENIQEKKDELSGLQQQEDELKEAPTQLEQLQQQQLQLGNPQKQYDEYEFQAKQRQETEIKLAQAKTEIQRIENDIARLQEELRPYANVDQEQSAAKAARDASEEAYQKYLRFFEQAQSLMQRQENVDALVQQIGDQQQKQELLKHDVAEINSRYDESTYQKVDREYNDLTNKQTTLTERLENRRGDLAKAEEKIKALQAKQGELQQKQAEQAKLQRLEEQVKFIRETIRAAGPYITRARVQRISHEANRIFGDILNNYALRLTWSESYEIMVESQGRQRTFAQLSGGEQMSAALAVRLALLKEMTGIDVAFFDEPTSNLDGERRDNLADQIMHIHGFSQLFVISHDDTFERSTHHVIRIEKDNGISQVMQ